MSAGCRAECAARRARTPTLPNHLKSDSLLPRAAAPATRERMTLIDGKAIAQRINEQTRTAISDLTARGVKPGLAVVVVGDDPASHAYVRSKEKTSRDLGMHSVKCDLPHDTTQAQLLEVVRALNADPAIHG